MKQTLELSNLTTLQQSESHSTYQRFAEFDAAYGFTEKCGFSLSPIQVEDVDCFVRWRVSGNFFEVGGGKTVVSTVVSLMRSPEVTVITVPPILITPWMRWLNLVSSGAVAYRGTPKKREKLDILGCRWLVVSHSLFRSDFTKLYKALKTRQSLELIVDEAHALKNIESKLYQYVQALAGDDCFLQMLTGTPISKPLDAYAYIALKTPTLYRSYAQIENLYIAEKDFFGRVVEYRDLPVLAKHFAMQTITRTKLEIHGYNNPPNYPDASYDLENAHYSLYEQLVDEQMLKFEDGQKIDASSAVKLYHALQQIVINYDYFSRNPEKRSAAYDLIDLTMEQTQCNVKPDPGRPEHSKLIIWTNYKLTSASVLRYLLNKGVVAVAAYGGSNAEKSVEAFMLDPKTRVLVAQYQSAGMGLNPQGVCWESLFIELTTVPIYMRQALGRLDRVGQLHVPTQRLAVAVDTIQEAILARLLSNDDNAVRVEVTKESLRATLLGRGVASLE